MKEQEKEIIKSLKDIGDGFKNKAKDTLSAQEATGFARVSIDAYSLALGQMNRTLKDEQS